MAQHSLDAYLSDLVSGLVEELPEVSTRRMFGCDAWFANGHIFSLVWDARVAVKLPEPAHFEALAAMDGAEPWSPMPSRPMSHWLLVPEAFHDDVEALQPWVELAHRAALMLPPKELKVKKAAKKKPAKVKKAKR